MSWPCLGKLFGGCGRRDENKNKVNWLRDPQDSTVESNLSPVYEESYDFSAGLTQPR